MKPKLFCTREIPKAGIEILEPVFEITLNREDRVLRREEIVRGLSDKQALLCLLTDTIDREMIQAASSLRVISNYAVGYNNIDVEAATEKGIPVTNTPGVLTETTADLTWALLLAAARRIVEGDRIMRAGLFQGWGPLFLLGNDVHGKILGIVGAGRIGRAVAQRAAGFRTKVLYANPGPCQELDARGATRSSLDALLKSADFVTLHVPLSEETHHLIGENQLQAMKRTAILINTSRGPVVHEDALVRALREGWIGGAALDVYEKEPALAEGLAEMENVVVAPHLGSASTETRTRMAVIAAENAVSAIQGEKPAFLVNPEVYGSD